MGILRQCERARLHDPRTFIWATGIEDTFITAPHPATGRTLDEYELTDHYNRCLDDIALIAELGVGAARYGLPWHRINPSPGVWNWEWADRPLNRMLELGVEPIVDLVHYGVPGWIENAWLHPDFPRHMAEYSARVADRFKGRVHAYTPLNEPRITAWYCGRIGWWPPFLHGWRGFVRVMLQVCRGIVESTRALRAVDPDIMPVHVDATDLYESPDPRLADRVRERQDIVFLALDLVSGRIDETHALWPWLLRHGAQEHELHAFRTDPLDLPLIGLNLYPMFTRKVGALTQAGRVRWRMPYADASIIDRLSALYAARYDTPVFISETASVGSVERRGDWLRDAIEAVRRTRAAGVPLVGFTWWPLFALVTWAYRQGTRDPAYYLKQMGLWDLDAHMNRKRTPLVDAYRELTRAQLDDVGDRAAAQPI